MQNLEKLVDNSWIRRTKIPKEIYPRLSDRPILLSKHPWPMAGLDPQTKLQPYLGQGSLAQQDFRNQNGGFIGMHETPAQTQAELDKQNEDKRTNHDQAKQKIEQMRQELKDQGVPEKRMPKLPPEFKPKPTPNSAAPSGAKFEYHPGGGIHSNKIPSSQAMGGPTSRSILKKTKLKAERIAERRRHRARDIELAGMAHSRPVVRPDTSTTTYLTREQTQAESTAVSPQKIWSQRDRQQRKPAIPTWLRSTKKRLKNVWKKNQESNHRQLKSTGHRRGGTHHRNKPSPEVLFSGCRH
jgi:hypothetical protein